MLDNFRAHIAWCQKSYSPEERKNFINRFNEPAKKHLKERINESVNHRQFDTCGHYSVEALTNVTLDSIIEEYEKNAKYEENKSRAFKSLGLK